MILGGSAQPLTTRTRVPIRPKSQSRSENGFGSRMQPCDSRRLVPTIQSGWIWLPLLRYVGIRWKPMPHAANRVKFWRIRLPLASWLRRILADRPQ